MPQPQLLLITVEQQVPDAQTVGPAVGIVSAAALGTPTIDRNPHVRVTGITSGAAFGTTKARYLADPTGASTAEAFGISRIIRETQIVHPAGLPSAAALPGAAVLLPIDRSKLLSDLRAKDELGTALTLLDTAKVAATVDRSDFIVAVVADSALISQVTADAVADIRDVRGEQPLIFSQDVSGVSAEDLDNPVAGFEVFGDVRVSPFAAQTVSHAGAISSLIAFGVTIGVIPGQAKTVTGVGAIASAATVGTTSVVIPGAAQTVTGVGAMSSHEAFGNPTASRAIYNLLFLGGTPKFKPWTATNDDTTSPTQTPTFFGHFDVITGADGSKIGRFAMSGTTDASVTKERVMVYYVESTTTSSGIQWFGYDFWLSPGYPTPSTICQLLWQPNSPDGVATPPALALKARPDVNGLFLYIQAGVSGGSIPFVYEFKSVDGGTWTTPPGQLWAIPQGSMLINAWYQIKLGVKWSTKSPRNPLNTGPADGWIKCYYRLAGSNTWINSVDASGFATVRVNVDGSIPGPAHMSDEIYDLGHRAVYRELQSHGLIVADTEAFIDQVMSGTL